MAGDIKVLSVEEIRTFERACETFIQEVESIQRLFFSHTDILSESWKDDRFKEFSELMNNVDLELVRACDTTKSQLLPYMQAKRRVMEERP